MRSCRPPGNENRIIGRRGHLDAGDLHIGTVAEIEVCRSAFNLGNDELIDRVETDGAEPDGVRRRGPLVEGKRSAEYANGAHMSLDKVHVTKFFRRPGQSGPPSLPVAFAACDARLASSASTE